ncbi:unnamed protein product [Clavelina lepadiformis]|uniref:Hexosyltransferase n=1 Tax=Clavelina lepadiformis TaxID=159417 RepID=A0ABP0GMH3_CLALP
MKIFLFRKQKLSYFIVVLGLAFWTFFLIIKEFSSAHLYFRYGKSYRNSNANKNQSATQTEMTLQPRNVRSSNKTTTLGEFLPETASGFTTMDDFLKEPVLNSEFQINNCLSGKNRQAGKNISWSMIIFIKSATDNRIRRDWIRKAWGSIGYLDGATFQTVFVIGQADATTQALLDEEYSRYRDILQVDASDAYLDVGLKTLSGMRWTLDKLPHQYFYSSGDDDMMIDLVKLKEAVDKNIAKVSEKKWPEFPIICTYKTKLFGRPIREKKHKNYISRQDYRRMLWPKYCLGGFYTTSVRVIRQLWEASLNSKRINTDDVFITGILREKIGMPAAMVVPGIRHTCQHMGGFNADKFNELWSNLSKKLKKRNICFNP